MQKLHVKPKVKTVLLSSLFIIMLSASSRAGGYAFEIYLNNKLLLKQQYKTVVSGSPLLQLTTANSNDNLKIMFTNCGMTRATRSISLKDENEKTIKEWQFPNANSDDFVMTIPVKEILALQKKNLNTPLRIFYYSPDQFKQGHMLATLQPEGKKVAMTNRQMNHWPAVAASLFVIGAIGYTLKRRTA